MKDATINDHNSVLLIGGPDAGKSNFLFRLWMAISDGRGILVQDGLPSDMEYVRDGAERLLEGEFAGHTSKDVHERVVVPVKTMASDPIRRGMLVLPDVNGEQVLAIYRNRQWSKDWEHLISAQCACLLFIRAGSDEMVAPLDWVTCFEKYGAVIDGDGVVPVDDKADEDDATVEIPTQVLLTEWLQFLRRAFTATVGSSFRPRIGVIVSAWDAVPTDQQSDGPTKYLQRPAMAPGTWPKGSGWRSGGACHAFAGIPGSSFRNWWWSRSRMIAGARTAGSTPTSTSTETGGFTC
jgi:hypothetical protein